MASSEVRTDTEKPATEPAVPAAATRRPLLTAMSVLVAGLFGIWVIGQCVFDLTWYTALCFYIPSPVVGAALLLQSSWLLGRQRQRSAAVFALLAAFPLGFTVLVENQWAAPRNTAETENLPHMRLVHWNTWYGERGWDPVMDRLRSLKADIYVLSESARGYDVEAAAKSFGPEFHVLRFEDMAVFARGELVVHERLPIGRHGWARLIDWKSPAGLMRILAVDFPSHPRTHRAPLLAELRRQIEQWQPDFVVGDMNAPRRSPGLRDLPAGYRHTYLSSGSGWSYTWPVICPLWAIDQCIAGRRVHPLHYELQSTTVSDHRLQLCDFAFATDEKP